LSGQNSSYNPNKIKLQMWLKNQRPSVDGNGSYASVRVTNV
jgi:hypothetical protein